MPPADKRVQIRPLQARHHILTGVAVLGAGCFGQLRYAAVFDKQRASIGTARRRRHLFAAEPRSADPWIFHVSIPRQKYSC